MTQRCRYRVAITCCCYCRRWGAGIAAAPSTLQCPVGRRVVCWYYYGVEVEDVCELLVVQLFHRRSDCNRSSQLGTWSNIVYPTRSPTKSYGFLDRRHKGVCDFVGLRVGRCFRTLPPTTYHPSCVDACRIWWTIFCDSRPRPGLKNACC